MESVFSLLFFALIFIYLGFGISIIKLNFEASVNKAFLAVCICMSIWSLGFAMANTAISLELALFWRRISAIGWTIVYAIILHFLILLTYGNSSMNQKWFFKLLYIPAFINMYIFSFSNSMAKIQYNLKKFDFGWINISVNNRWDWFFYLYYALYIVVGLLAVWKWKQKLENKRIAKQGNLIIISFISALVFGSLTDIVVSPMFARPLPQMAPVFILLPTWAMWHSARYYGIMRRKNPYKVEIVATDEDQKSIFRNMSMAFCAASVLSFVSEYIPLINGGNGNLKLGLIKSGILISIGLSIGILQQIRKESIKEALTIMILTLSIPIVTLQFAKYSGLTVWVFPMIIIISSLIFSKRTLLISATVMAILTQRLIWILKPEAFIRIDQYDYIARIGLFIIAFLIGSYVNKIYVAKIKENNNQIAFQKMNSEISLEFVTINKENFNEKINKLLSMMGLFFQVDRIYLFLINHQDNTMTYSNEWCNEGIESGADEIKEMPLDAFPWWIEQLKKNKFVNIEDVSTMPKESSAEQKQLIRKKVKSLISVPIDGEGNMLGFIGIDSVILLKRWSEENLKLLNILSNLISHGLAKIKAEKEIEFMAYYDYLTKLPNRLLFADRANQAINLAKRNGKFVSIIFVDLDNFKSVNDTIGHEGGDLLLKEVGQGLQKVVRKTDTVSRFGGDEFMILLNDIADHNDIFKIAHKIMDLFSKPFSIKGRDFLVTSSAGISIYPVDGEDAETLTKNADIAMYKAKGKGKNQYTLCTADMKEEVHMSMILSNDLYRALERNELVVYYQPQIDLATGVINGVEALLRWIHPERGMIPPAVFIPLAENNGLINSIGEWVLRIACIQNRIWQDMYLPHLRMAVNLSAIQFINPHIADDVQNILKESGLNPKYLELEITESIAIKEATYVEGILNKLKKIGITIAIDDFGTEYSSLSRLKMLPIDRIKIDMQFTKGIEGNEKDRAITMIIINLAKSLKLSVLAEGVETKAQMEFLTHKLCDDVQGYYYYKPMPAEEIEKILFSLAKQIDEDIV